MKARCACKFTAATERGFPSEPTAWVLRSGLGALA